MSATLSSVARTEFDSLVKHAYQGTGQLRNAVTVRNNVVGDTYKFRKMGKGLANQKSTSDLVTPMAVAHEFAVATLTNWNAPEYTDLFDNAETNFDEKQELATTIAGALGRREDQLIVDALNAATPVGATLGSDAEQITAGLLAKAKAQLVGQGAGAGNHCAIINGDGLADMLSDVSIGSIDYNSVKAMVAGEIDTFMGFKFYTLADNAEGGLTDAADKVTSWFFAQDAVGLAVGIDMKTSIDYVPERTSWLCNGMLKAGAVVRDTAGIVKVEYDS
ncbi:MAG: phage capsid protein [Porticoccaceae bacterium]|nr:phage capsid protein [Porticoccaceae bacterium]